MNLYIMVEGLTEKKVYPLWLEELWPEMIRVENYDEVTNNNYFIFSSGGYPSILDDIEDAVEEMNETKKFDYLIIALDSDELTVEERIAEVKEVFEVEQLRFNLDKVIVLVQNKCFETWCLGNRKMFPTTVDTEDFQTCLDFYNVRNEDPEEMPRNEAIMSITTTSQYHEHYLKKMFIEKRQSYKKGSEKIVGQRYYLEQLIKRVNEMNHLPSFRYFINIIEKLKQENLINH